jgi:cell division transport system ATP-binding protein
MAMRLLRLFVELYKLGTTFVFATHDLQLVRLLDAPVMTLSNGHLHIRPPRSQRLRPEPMESEIHEDTTPGEDEHE